MGYESFKELRVWQEAKILAVEVYKITAKGGLAKDYGLKDQVQRSAVSIASNIAEGYDRQGFSLGIENATGNCQRYKIP